MDKDALVLYAARASRIENQDAIDASIVGMLADPKEVPTMFRNGQSFMNISTVLA